MLNRIKSLVKNNKTIYKLYSVFGSALLHFVGLFVKTDPNLILFASYGGRKFDDSPRVVYEYLQKNPVSPDHKFVWAFVDPSAFPQVPNRIKIDTPAYYLTALKAGYWITNSSISRGMDFKKKKTMDALFTHGLTALKRIGADVVKQDQVFVATSYEKYDTVFVEGKFETPILANVWRLGEKVFHTTGLPRNDDLVHVGNDEIRVIKEKLGIPCDKKVVLYAPTFRDWSQNTQGRNIYRIPIDFVKWQKKLGKDYVLMINGHYAISEILNLVADNDFVFNTFGYPELNDLLIIADILISDYSSIVFDYSILGRPIFGYCYDFDEYMAIRGSYIDIEQFYRDGAIRNEDSLLDAIVNLDYEVACRFTKEQIRDKYLASYGDAARKAVEVIFGSQRELN